MSTTKIIAVVNQKGGVGKTTTAINLAASLAEYGQNCLLIDFDPQANTTSGLGLDKNSVNGHIYQVLLGNTIITEAVQHTVLDQLNLIPSHINLVGAELELVSVENREFKLKQALTRLPDRYKYIIIDCPPSLGLLTINALTAADSLLVPIQCEYFAMEGVSQLLKTVELVQNHLNPSLSIEGVLLTMMDSRVNLSGQVIEEIKKFFGDKVYHTIVPRNIRLAEAPSYGKPVLLYDKASRGAQTYLDLAVEVMEINSQWERPATAEPQDASPHENVIVQS